MTTQSKMFFVKSFKASDLYRGTVWWVDATYTKRKSIASKYISALRACGKWSVQLHPGEPAPGGLHQFLQPGALEDFDQGVAVRLQDLIGDIQRQFAQVGTIWRAFRTPGHSPGFLLNYPHG